MTEGVYEKSKKIIKAWLLQEVVRYPSDEPFAIFGTSSYCQYLMKNMAILGFHRGYYISSYAEVDYINGISVRPLNQVSTSACRFILLGSLSGADVQHCILKEMGVEVDILSVPNGSYLSSEYIGNIYDKKRLKQLKNMHEGQTVFIIGNGPSLKSTDPRKISNFVTMGANGICKLEGFEPDYYFMLDTVAPEYWRDEINNLSSMKLVPPRLKECDFDQINAIFYPTVYQLQEKVIDPYNYGLPSGRSVISTMIYFAIYMGFKKIIFIGVDNDYGKNQKNMHFLESYYPVKFDFGTEEVLAEMVDRRKEGINQALSVAIAHGVECFDASPRKNMGIPTYDFSQNLF